MNLKKLIATATFALGAWMSVSVAQAGSDLTYYNFNFTGTSGSYATVVGALGVDGTGAIQSITGTVSGTGNAYGGQIGGLNNGFFGPDNLYSTTAPFFTNNGIAFYTGSDPGSYNNLYNLYSNSATDYFLQAASPDGNAGGTMNSSAAAPEMNASLIPQVGLMLSCLFFLLGRKKENAEPILTA